MKDQIAVLVAGRSRPEIDSVAEALKGHPALDVRVRHMDNGHSDPLYGVTRLPDILVLDLSMQWEEELRALTTRPASERCPLIVIGPDDNPQFLRVAMQAGARDFFKHPVQRAELLACLEKIAGECVWNSGQAKASLTAVINAKGGSGASFIACNLAHIIAVHFKHRVALIDLDLQFGMLPIYMNLQPQDSIFSALANVHELDSVALQAHMSKHPSGLHLLPSMSEHVPLPWQISPHNLQHLLDQAMQTYTQIVVDLPRLIDPLTRCVLERADQTMLVVQQGVTHLRDAKRLIRIITKDLGVPSEHIHVVVNRHDKKHPVGLNDIGETLQMRSLLVVPNDFARASESVNLGVPLYDSAKGAAITKAIVDIAARISGSEEVGKAGRFRSVIANLLRT